MRSLAALQGEDARLLSTTGSTPRTSEPRGLFRRAPTEQAVCLLSLSVWEDTVFSLIVSPIAINKQKGGREFGNFSLCYILYSHLADVVVQCINK